MQYAALMRTRFAPSPTGFLHVGGLRTALYAYLVAKQTGGTFTLRIEDTDQARTVIGAAENILRTLHWAGLDPDEGVMLRDGFAVQEGGHGPYVQSERLPLYREYVEKLLASGHAYRAFDTEGEIDEMRAMMQREGFTSPNYNAAIRMRMKNSLSLSTEEVARRIEAGEPYVVRFKMPDDEAVAFDDDVRGRVTFQTKLLDDQVLLKSDGFPTYHLAHVVDDHLMDIDIVIRGEEWLSSLPKHLLLFQALGWKPPRYAHVSLLLNADRTKLSKRQGDVAVEEYINKGYLPEALLNFLALLGWNPGTEQEVFSLPELIDAFSIERVQKAGAIFDLTKLDWLQGQWMRKFSDAEFVRRLVVALEETLPAVGSDPDIGQKAALIKDRIQFFAEGADLLRYFYEEPSVEIEMLANKKQKVARDDLPRYLGLLIDALAPINVWDETSLKVAVEDACARENLKLGQLLWPLRVALTGLPYSPGAYEVAVALGKEKTLERLQSAAASLRS